MSTRDEEVHALQRAHALLAKLLKPSETPRLPRAIRDEARSVLRHYPGPASVEMNWARTGTSFTRIDRGEWAVEATPVEATPADVLPPGPATPEERQRVLWGCLAGTLDRARKATDDDHTDDLLVEGELAVERKDVAGAQLAVRLATEDVKRDGLFYFPYTGRPLKDGEGGVIHATPIGCALADAEAILKELAGEKP